MDVLPESTHKTAYTYDADNRVTEVKYDNSDTHKVNYTYDLLNRVTNKTVTNGTAYSTNYTYVAGDTTAYGANATTPLISTITQGSGANAMNFAYTYDSRGNITSETRNGVTVSYEYDELGQLIRVNDPNDPTAGAGGTTWIYTYDRGGNILNKAAHTYTTGDVSSTELQWPYTYGDSNWKDKLTGYKDKTFTYDAIGNLVHDDNDYHPRHFDWEAGRRLKELSGNGYSIEYKYDHNGQRTQKVIHHDWYPEITNYILRGKNISRMTVDYHDWDEIPQQNVLYFYYDAQDKPVKVSFNGAVYTYIKNLQGDIVGILDSNGALVVEYKYDAWGRPLSTSGNMADTLGRRNPFRYRGYVYDEESDLYYLRSRYYDPEMGRFLNADKYLGKIGRLLSSNMFMYAKCNPILRVDNDGTIDIVFFSSDCYDKFLVANIDQSGVNYFVQVDGKRYPANSHETISLYKWAEVETDFMETTFHRMIEEASEYSGIMSVLAESIGGELDFKLRLKEESNDKLYLIDGTIYNRNEAGNFMWSYFLRKHGYPRIVDDLLAQGGSIAFASRFDEPHDVRARNAGERYWLKEKIMNLHSVD